MKQLEILANEMVADKLVKELSITPVTGEKWGVKPENGASVLIHNWVAETEDGDEGYDHWEVVRWYEEGTVLDLGVDTSGVKENKLWAALTGKKVQQEIKQDGFYWKEEDTDDGQPGEWVRIADGQIDCWCELIKTNKGKIIKEMNRIDAALERASLRKTSEDNDDEDESDDYKELMFQHSFRLCNGMKLVVKTIASKDWKDGKRLPDDVGAFEWKIINDTEGSENSVVDSGKFSARFSLPDEGEQWDTDDMAEQVIQYVLKKEYKIKNTDGIYDQID